MHRILISAYGCEPNKGSEQGVGWHWVLELAKTQELWVITRINNQQGIESALPASLVERIHFIYYDLPVFVKRFKRKEKGLYFYYALWQWGAYKRAKQLLKEINFDFSMHLTFGSMWMPTFMHKLPIPFLWGPIGGGESVPPGYIKTLSKYSRFFQYARQILIRSSAFNPLIVGPAKKAHAIIARTEDSQKVIPKKYQHKVKVMLETGMSDEVLNKFIPPADLPPTAQIEIIYTGRLVAFKNVAAAIHALALVIQRCNNVRLTIVGDGPQRKSLSQLTNKVGIFDNVRFVGTATQAEVIEKLQQSDIFIYPSLREAGTWALMEAMAVGLPVICLDTSGMHVITDDDCAIRIKPSTPEKTIEKMSEAILLLAGSAKLRQEMGRCGRCRIAEHFTWPSKGFFMQELLVELEGQAKSRGPR